MKHGKKFIVRAWRFLADYDAGKPPADFTIERADNEGQAEQRAKRTWESRRKVFEHIEAEARTEEFDSFASSRRIEAN